MEKLVGFWGQVKDLVGGLLQQHLDVFNSNPDIVTAGFSAFVIVILFLFLKGLFDKATGSNKKALKFHIGELRDKNFILEKRLNELAGEYNELLYQKEALEDENYRLKVTAFEKIFPKNILDKILENCKNIPNFNSAIFSGSLEENLDKQTKEYEPPLDFEGKDALGKPRGGGIHESGSI